MKTLTMACALIPATLLADPSDSYVNFIRQVQRDSGLEWDVTVPPNGEQVSPTGVSYEGSYFELWAIHDTTSVEYLLDEQFVTSYTPNAFVEILTEDPYRPVPRTRVDRPFQVRVTVTGLLDPSDPTYDTAPVASKIVSYTHSTFNYPEGTHSLVGVESPVGTVLQEGTMDGNTTATVTHIVTNLTGPDLTLVEGEEVITVAALEDFGVSETILDSKRVQIWPIAQGTISGYDTTVRYDVVPPVTVDLIELYPASTTYVRVYPGPPQENPTNAQTIHSSYVVVADSIPQDRTLVLTDLDAYFNKEGEHTVEVLHETPFGTDLLAGGAIRVDRTIEVTGSLYVSD